MTDRSRESGKFKLGLILFIVLLAAVVGRYTYKYLDKATRLNDEAIELMNQEKYDTALDKLDEALEDDPQYVPAHYHRGICLAEKHRFDEAVAAFDRTLELDPKEADAYFNKGKIFWYEREYEKALQSFEKAADLIGNLEKPNRNTVWRYVGECHYEMHLDKLANAPEEAGSPNKALSAFKTYLQDRPGAADRSAIEQKIQILENPDEFKEVIEKRKEGVKPGKRPIKLEELRDQIPQE